MRLIRTHTAHLANISTPVGCSEQLVPFYEIYPEFWANIDAVVPHWGLSLQICHHSSTSVFLPFIFMIHNCGKTSAVLCNVAEIENVNLR